MGAFDDFLAAHVADVDENEFLGDLCSKYGLDTAIDEWCGRLNEWEAWANANVVADPDDPDRRCTQTELAWRNRARALEGEVLKHQARMRELEAIPPAFRALQKVKPILYAALVLTIIAAWFFRFHTVQEKSGRTIRVNRLSGEMVLIDGQQAKVIQPKAEAEKHAPTGPMHWPPNSLVPVESKVYTSTAWRDNEMVYHVSIRPYTPKLKDLCDSHSPPFPSITLLFNDDQGFEVASVDVTLLNMAQMVSGENIPEALDYRSSVSLGYDKYSSIKSVDVRWRFSKIGQ